MMTELKPCPFCGGKAMLDHSISGLNTTSFIRCNGCYVSTKRFVISTRASSDMEAIEAWNRRITDANGQKEVSDTLADNRQ